jgi:hypothetical protein
VTQVTVGWTQMRGVAQFSARVQAPWCITVADLHCCVLEGVCDEQDYKYFSVICGHTGPQRLRVNEW